MPTLAALTGWAQTDHQTARQPIIESHKQPRCFIVPIPFQEHRPTAISDRGVYVHYHPLFLKVNIGSYRMKVANLG
jgi:hypothetical protein